MEFYQASAWNWVFINWKSAWTRLPSFLGDEFVLEFIRFEDTMLDAAAELLCENYSSLRARGLALLPKSFEKLDNARKALKRIITQSKAMGLAAVEKGQLRAFLIGTPAVNPIRGRHVWIYPAGLGIDPTCSLELLRELYARLGEVWVRNGFFDHFILALNNPKWLEPWLRLGFAYEQAHALLDLDQFPFDSLSPNPEITVRRATEADRETVQSFYNIIPRQHAAPPVWGVALPEDLPEIYEGYGELLDEEGTTLWLAYWRGRPVGLHAYRTLLDGVDFLAPAGALRLTVASTVPEARGQGVSSTLLAVALQDAYARGYRVCETDWRITNLLSSRHWEGKGFKEVAKRLVRKVDQRIVWADGYNELP